MNKIVMTLLSLMIVTTLSQGIIDFEYTQFAQSAHNDIKHQVNLEFSPIQTKQENLQFPAACHLIDQLTDQIKQKQNHFIDADIDEYLQSMKQKFLDLLTISQKLTNSQNKILHFQGLINKTNPVPPNKQQIFQLEQYQRSLSNLTNFIKQKQKQLRANFTQMKFYNENTQQVQSQRVQINFNVDLLKQKINYLKDLQQKIRLALSNRQPTNFNNYFDQLERQFNNQTLLIQNIDSIIRKKDDLAKLKKQKSHLQSSITALDLYINDVGLCYQQKQKIRKEFKNHQKINQLISELRQLKQNQQPNIYCQGVVKKLTQKIKTMLRYYDIVASCASDLPQKVNSLKKQKEDLAQVIIKIKQLEAMQNFDEFQRTYNSQRDRIQTMYTKIKDWKIKQFTHNPDQIAQIRQSAQEQLNLLLKRKSQSKSAYNEKSDSKTISMTLFNLIHQLKNAKAQYCALYHKYDTLANKLWTDSHQYEAQMSLKNKLLKLQYEERLKYEQLSKQLIYLRAEIYQKLNK